MKFVITGLPRMRSAWFAAYFTNGKIHCHHEATRYNLIPANGSTEPGGYLICTEWVKRLGEHKLVIIHRKVDEVEESLANIGLPVGLDLDRMSRKLYELNGLHIEFDDINERLEGIHEHIGIPFDERRAELFKSLNIQATEWSR